MTRNYSFFTLFVLWFGAAISVAEILTAALIADAPLNIAIIAIFAAHLCGAFIMALMGIIGFQTKNPALVCSRRSFGFYGSWLLSFANIIQLVGWTAVMLQQGGQAIAGIMQSFSTSPIFTNTSFAIIILAFFVGTWAYFEAIDRKKANLVAVILLFGLSLFLANILFTGEIKPRETTMNFGAAFDLVFIMPLSWIMLVADYSCRADSQKTAAFAPAIGYFIASSFMYFLGLFGVLIFNESNPVALLLASGFGFVALGIICLSALTTTFLDVYSAAVSAINILPNISKKLLTSIFVFIGAMLALIWDTGLYMGLLHFIGAIFAPISAIICYDYFIAKTNYEKINYNIIAFISLVLGVLIYNLLSSTTMLFGTSFTTLILTFVVHSILRKALPKY